MERVKTMTELLYLNDAYLQTFEARVVERLDGAIQFWMVTACAAPGDTAARSGVRDASLRIPTRNARAGRNIGLPTEPPRGWRPGPCRLFEPV